jgi:hypothetical protein
MNKKLYILLFVFIYSALISKAVDLPKIIDNTIYSDNIKTVELYRNGWKLSNPILMLNSDEQLVLSFDDLNDERSDYYFTIYHCDRNWNISKIAQEEYLDSFVDFPITDFEYSINTTVKYINYMLRLPNSDIPIVLSGNYALVVFDRDNPDQPIFTKRFYVVDAKTSIDARIRRATFDPRNEGKQEIDFIVNHGNFSITDPISDVKVVVKQNNRTDNAITNLKPQYFGNGILEYNYDNENTFPGVNEFRVFENRGIKHPGEGIEELKLHHPFYHATLFTHKIRTQNRYSYYKEMNGNYFVEAYSKNHPDVEADYMFVHFTLKMNQPLLGGGVYVFGKLSNWQCSIQNQMTWNMKKDQYELTLLLKQGYYNFMYAYKDENEKNIKCENLEGSHYETENDYQIFVYYGKITDRYDRLIGYEKFNSLTKRNFNP